MIECFSKGAVFSNCLNDDGIIFFFDFVIVEVFFRDLRIGGVRWGLGLIC